LVEVLKNFAGEKIKRAEGPTQEKQKNKKEKKKHTHKGAGEFFKINR
jgi:hypothetical protein